MSVIGRVRAIAILFDYCKCAYSAGCTCTGAISLTCGTWPAQLWAWHVCDPNLTVAGNSTVLLHVRI